MDGRQAQQITDAMEREPGLVLVTAQIGGVTIQVFGEPMLSRVRRDYPADESSIGKATSEALILALNEGLAQLIDFQPEEPRP